MTSQALPSGPFIMNSLSKNLSCLLFTINTVKHLDTYHILHLSHTYTNTYHWSPKLCLWVPSDTPSGAFKCFITGGGARWSFCLARILIGHWKFDWLCRFFKKKVALVWGWCVYVCKIRLICLGHVQDRSAFPFPNTHFHMAGRAQGKVFDPLAGHPCPQCLPPTQASTIHQAASHTAAVPFLPYSPPCGI